MLEIGGYESDLLSDLVASYLFETSKTHFCHNTYHGLHRNDGLVAFKGKKTVLDIIDRLGGFRKIANKAAGNQHLQFTVEIWTSDLNTPHSEKKDTSQTCMANRLPFLDMNNALR